MDPRLFDRLSALALRAGRAVATALAEDLAGEVKLAWVELAERDPARARAILEQPDARLYRWCLWRARNALGAYLREAHDELSDTGQPVEPTPVRCDAPGKREMGDHIATEDELYELLRHMPAEPLDLIRAYEATDTSTRTAVRLRVSGYSKSEIGSRAFARAGAVLRSVA